MMEEKMTTTSSLEQQQAPERRSIDQSKIAYQKPQPAGMVPDVFVGSALELDGDERKWVPQSPTVAFRPLVLNVSQGYYINILRVRSSGVLSRHRHSGPVHAITLRGRWRRLSKDNRRQGVPAAWSHRGIGPCGRERAPCEEGRRESPMVSGAGARRAIQYAWMLRAAGAIRSTNA
jgi:hypothetical protein